MDGTIGVVGAGTMGAGIAQLALQSGFAVRLCDAFPQARERGRERIQAGLEKGVVRHKITRQEADLALDRLAVVSDLEDLAGARIVVEAAPEDLALKREIFARLDELLPESTILATNTSSLSVAKIAEGLGHPERLVGLHFFNPPVVMKLVEVVSHAGVGKEAYAAALGFAKDLGRTPVEVQDTAGFLVNRVVRSYYLVAQRLAAEGAGSFSQIDAAVKKVGTVPLGPFELMDFIGLEVNLAITKSIYEGLGRPSRLCPHPIQEGIVAAGAHGRKTGSGFYLYEGKEAGRENPVALALLPGERAPLSAELIWDRIMEAIIAEAETVVSGGVASQEGVDTAVRLAMNFPKGPFEWKRAAPVS